MKHLIIINLWHVLHEICLFFNANAIFGWHWNWKIYPHASVKWCVKNYGCIKAAEKALLWWHK